MSHMPTQPGPETAPPPQDAPPRPAPATPLERNPAAVYLAALTSQHSRRTMRSALGIIADILMVHPVPQPQKPRKADFNDNPIGWEHAQAEYRAAREAYDRRALRLGARWGQLRYPHTAAIRVALVERFQPATANKLLAALRGVLKAAWRLGYMNGEDYQRAVDLDRVKGKGSPLPAGRDLSEDEITALFLVCAEDEKEATAARDAGLLAVLCAGLRRAEIVALDVSDYDSAQGQLRMRGTGGRARTAYLDSGAMAAVADWLAVRGPQPGALFLPVNKGGVIQYTQPDAHSGRAIPARLTDQAVYNMLKKRGEEAGLQAFSPHDFRRTFVSGLLDAGADLVTVAKLAGHASVETTARYDRRPEEARRKTANLRQTPYRKRQG